MAREMAKKPRYIYAEFATFLLVLMCLGSLNLCEASCSDTPVGVRDELKVIPDDNMTASSVLPGFPAKDGRLAETGTWCANGSDTDPYLEISLSKSYVICGVEVQGKPNTSEPTTFTLQSSTDGSNFTEVDSGRTFNASSAGGDVATFHVLTTNVTATHLRFKPVSNVICLRVEIYAVPENVTVICQASNISVAIQKSLFTDTDVTFAATDLALNDRDCNATNGSNTFDFEITHGTCNTELTISKDEERSFYHNVVFDTKADPDDPEFDIICSYSSSCSNTPVGVRDELKVIPDDYMTASSVLPGFPAKDGRLAGTGAWCPLTNGSDADPYLEISLGKSYVICGVEVQGKPNASEPTNFTLQSSTDGSNFTEVDSGKTFNASSAGGDVATFHALTTNVIATHLRFKPVSNVTCLRVEIYAVPDIDECDSDPCKNGANCTDGVNNYTCTCMAGYEGPNCAIDINECLSGPCKNGANCTDGVNNYTCTCIAGYEGPNCALDINECLSGPCKNGANCTDGVNNYTCTCMAGHEGPNCALNINECLSGPCENGANCTDGVNNYTCTCMAGYEGPNCALVDPCYTDPCENDGQCFVDDNYDFFCVCPIPKAYEGKNCSKPVDCFWNKMYPYGEEQNDTEMDVGLIRDELCKEVLYDYGIWFFDDKHYVLYICANGMIRFDIEYVRYFPVPTFDVEEFPFEVPMLFPFWSKIDMYNSFCSNEQDCPSDDIDYENRSAVFYQVYREDNNAMNASYILDKASKDVRENSNDPEFQNFTASWVLVVTWLRLRPEEEDEGDAEEGVTNTFQAVLVTDGTYTFLKYHYPCNSLQWASPKFYELFPEDFGGYPVAGINAGDGNLEDAERFFSLEGSASPGITGLTLGRENADNNGEYFFRLERRTGDDPEIKCRKWSDWQEKYLKDDISNADNFIPACPCSIFQAIFSLSYFLIFSTESNRDCFISISVFPFAKATGSNSFVQGFIHRKCCYSTFLEDFGALLTESSDPGSLEVNYIDKPEDLLDDAEAKQACCFDSFSCDLYEDVRPSDDCERFFIFPRRWFWGDPHFKTLDDKDYTFNGVGEYTMVDGKNGTFKLQARTVLAPGNRSIATVFSAGAAQENGSSRVEVRAKSGGGLEMYINGTSYAEFDSLTNISKEIGENLRAAQKNPGCVEVTFKSGSGVEFCEAKGMMSFVVTLSNEFLNNTKGLLGTYNNNPDDDYTLPDGTTLGPNVNSSTIHYDFGLKWQITAEESLFTYGPNEGVHTFANASFKPMFVEAIKWADNATEQAAKDACGDEVVCLFDAASTNDVSIGTNSKDVNVKLVKENEKLANFPPKFTDIPSVIEATVGKVLWVNVTAKDNNSFTFNVIKKPQGATFNTVGKYLLNFTWNVTSKEKVKFTFTATDEFNASVSFTPTIKMCACESNGQCVKPAQGDKLNNDSKFIIQGCTCTPGYTGRFCENDIDACKVNGNPCFKGVTCNDTPAPANLTGFTCGACPPGYSGNGIKCADIDECKNNSTNQCEQECVNNPGSYSCKCNFGFKLNSNGTTCDDINECEPVNDCMHQCNNTAGSYKCYCDEFFEVDPGDLKACKPTNPCNNSDCQICFIKKGNSEACDCKAGFKLASDGKTCEDIDECKIDGIRCTQKCENKDGGYDCKCYPGYQLDADGFTCSDINECLNSSLFSCPGKSRVCENIPGSYKCKCQSGLFYINNTCTALKPGEKPPEPAVPTPKEASDQEKKNAIEIKLKNMEEKQYNASVDEKFRTTCAKSADTFCQKDKAACGITNKRRRRSTAIITKDDVHLLPGFPLEDGNSLRIAFYILLPSSLPIPVNALETVINNSRAELEQVLGATISEIKSAIVLTTPSSPTTTSNMTTAPSNITTRSVTIATTEKTNDDWKWIVIGVCVGVLVLVLIAVIVFCVKKEKHTAKISSSHQALNASDENYNRGADNHGHEMTVYHGQQPVV